MKAIRVHEFGDPSVLQFEEAPMPEPASGEVRIKVAAAGLNFIDIYQRTGAYPLQRPVILGLEGAGVIDIVGPDVPDLKPGDRVAWTMQPASYAEYVTVPAGRLIIVPDDIDIRDAAAVMLQGLTAHYLCNSTFAIQPGDTALVHAAAGGVGLLLVQMIKQRGGWVAGTVSTEEKAESGPPSWR